MKRKGISLATLLRMKAEKLIQHRPPRHNSLDFIEGDILKLLHELEVYSVELELQNEELLNAGADAEKLLFKNKFSEDIKLRLIHELEINQIELEIQNEELVFSNALSQDIAIHYSDLFNFSSSGYLILSRDGEIQDLNFTGARLLEKDRLRLKNSQFGFFVSEFDRPVYNEFIEDLFKESSKLSCEVKLVLEDSKSINVLLSGILTQQQDQCLITIVDITERKQSTKYRELTREILQLMNEPGSIKESLHRTLAILKERTGFDAVGIRLQEGTDFPYLEQAGFSADFMLSENTLIERDKLGEICWDKKGNAKLFCTCGLVISGKAEPTNPNVTPGGSWWTNDSLPFLKVPQQEDERFQPRNTCIHQGYLSIALIPIRANDKIIGLIQFNDKRTGVFNQSKIELLEGIASHIGAVLMRKQVEETLQKNENLLRTITQNAPDIIIQLDQHGAILYTNRPFPGYTLEDCIGKNFCAWTLPEYHDLMKQSLRLVFEASTTQTYLSQGNDILGEMKWYRTSISPVKEGDVVANAILIIRDITESISSEEILRESELKRKAILMTAMDGFWISDLMGCILEVNDTYSQMIGYSRQELLTMRIQEIEVAETSEKTARHIKKIIKLGEDRFETRHRCKDGRIIEIEASVQYRKEQGGQFVVFLHDITERKKNEELLLKSNELYRLLFENSGDAIMFTNPDGSVYSANPEACKIFGRTENEIIRLGRNGIVDKNDSRLTLALEERKKTGVFKGELNYLRKDGSIFPVDVSSTIFKDSTGNERTCILARDITDRKKAEAKLQESENRYTSLFKSNHSVMLLVDPLTSEIKDANQAACNYYGWSLVEICRKKMSDINTLSTAEVFEAMRNAKEEQRNHFFFRHRLASHEIRDVEVYSGPIQFGDETLLYSLVHDITERKQAENELQRSKDNLRVILDATLESIYLFDEDGTIVDANVTAAKRLNRDLTEITGRNVTTVVPKKNQVVRLTHLKEVFASGKPLQFEDRRDDYIFEHNFFPVFNLDKVEHVVSFSRDITLSRKLEDSLKESEKKYRELVKYAPTGIYEVDIKTQKFVTINDVMSILSGYSQEELLSMNMLDILADESKTLFISRLEMLLKGELPNENVEYKIKAKDGHIIYATLDVKFTFDNDGVAVGATVIGHDITERVKMEEVLRASEQKLSEIYASMSEGLAIHELIFDGNGKAIDYQIVEVNPAYERITGIHQRDVVNRKATEIYVQEEAPFLDIYSEVECTGVSKTFETYFAPMDKYFSISVFSPGKGRFVTVFRDITIQKQASEALKVSEEKFRNLVFDMEVGVLLNGTQSEILLANPKALELLGLTDDQIKGKTPFDPDWHAIHEDGTPFPGDTHPAAQVIATGKPVKNVVMGIFKPTLGEHVWFLMNAQPHLDGDGALIQVVTTFIDISELRHAQNELKESELRLKYHFENSPLAVVEWDNNFNVTQWSIEAERIFGWKKEETINKPIDQLNLIYEEDIPIVNSTMEKLTSGAEDTVVSYNRNITKSGSIINAIWYNSILLDQKGKMKSVMSLVQDVTLQMQAEKGLKDSEEKFSLVYEKSPYAISLSNLTDGRIVDVNEAFEKIFGLLKSEVVGRRTDELGLNMNSELREDILAEIRENGSAHDIESVFYTRSGETRILRYNIDIVESGNQKYLLNTAEDITARKEIEEALRESEFFFRESQQAGFIGSYKTDFETGKWESSEVLDEIFGIDKTYIRNVEGWLDIAHPDDREMMNHYLSEEVLMKGAQFNKEYRIVRKNDHATRWVHGLGRVDFDTNNVVKSLVGTIQDITERKTKEEALRKLNQTLAALSKSSLAMSQSKDEVEYLHQVCNIVVEDTDFAMVWIGYAENDTLKTIRPMASAGFSDDYLDSIKLSWDDNEFGRGPTGVAIRSGKVGMCRNMFTDPTFEPWREQALKRGYVSSVVFPLKTDDKIFGAITIYSKAPDSFLEDEIKLLSKLASDLAHGITTIRLRKARELAEEALKKSHNELEMTVKIRTAELVETNEALRHTEEKYRTVSDFATNWEFWVAPDDQMIYCSPSCERITGYTSTEFEHNPYLIFDIIHPDDLQMYQEHKNKELKGHVCEHEIQYRIHKRDGAIRWIGHFCRPVFDESGKFRGIRGSNKDITSRKKMEELLTTSNQKYKLLSENINDGIFICKNGKFEYANAAIYEIFGYNGRELEKMKLTELVMADYHEELENLLYSISPSNKSCNVEVECLRKDFSTVFVEILLNYIAKDKTVYGVVHDITEKKEFQKNMVKAIIQTEEKERAYFSKELHDGLGPLLSTIKLYLQWSERPNSNKSREEIIGKAGEILEEALATVKEVSNKLSPHLLTNYGLNSAIKSFVEKLNATDNYNIIFESNTTRRLGAETEASLYRATIECINNTLKYAHANNIYIKLQDTGSQIKLHYYDDGKGFDVQGTIAEHKGLGLFNMQNRLHTIGGKVELNSEPGNGVNYLFTVNI